MILAYEGCNRRRHRKVLIFQFFSVDTVVQILNVNVTTVMGVIKTPFLENTNLTIVIIIHECIKINEGRFEEIFLSYGNRKIVSCN